MVFVQIRYSMVFAQMVRAQQELISYFISCVWRCQDQCHSKAWAYQDHWSTDNQPILICYKTPYMPHKTLGYQKSPVRDWSPQHHKCLKKGVATMQAIATCAINREQAQQLYWSVLVPKIGYTLPQPYKTELTLCHTQQCVTKLFPLKFSQNTHKSIVYGSKNLGGLGLLDWFHLQGKS